MRLIEAFSSARPLSRTRAPSVPQCSCMRRPPAAYAGPLSAPQTRRTALRMLAVLSLGSCVESCVAAAQYDSLAPTYDVLDGSNPLTRLVGFDSLRASLLQHARGSVVELGAGTGVNLPYYPLDDFTGITSFTAIDESSAMLQRIMESTFRRPRQSIIMDTIVCDATSTPLASHSVDTVVSTFCLCVVDDPTALAKEMRRLVKRDGIALVLDYTRSSFAPLAMYQDVTASTVRRMSKGCTLNLELIPMLEDAGFEVSSMSSTLGGLVLALELRPVETY